MKKLKQLLYRKGFYCIHTNKYKYMQVRFIDIIIDSTHFKTLWSTEVWVLNDIA